MGRLFGTDGARGIAGTELTCELAMRFLTDFINGDEYFKVDSPHHNLRRARAQIKLLTEIEAKFDEMTEYVDSLIAE